MASASGRRTLDTDYITLRNIFAKQSDNSAVPANYVLASVGNGRTYWAQPSSLGALPTWNEIQMDSDHYVGYVLRIGGSNGISLSTLGSQSISSLQFIGQGFQSIDISGSVSLYAYSNYTLKNSFLIAAQGFVSSSSLPTETTVTIQSLREAPALSTNIISYQSLKIISSMNSPIDSTPFSGNMILSKTNSNTYPVFTGYNDFVFRTTIVPPTLGLELSSYSAKAFFEISSLLGTSYLSTVSSISSLYTQKDIFSIAFTSLSTKEFFYNSTNISTTYGLSNTTQITYNQKFGDTLARATIIQLNDQFGLLNVGLSTVSSYKTPVYIMTSTNQGFLNRFSSPTTLSTSTFLNFTAGSIFNFRINGIGLVSTQLSTLSTSIGSNIFNIQTRLNLQSQFFITSTTSTFQTLGSLGYISSLESTNRGLATLGYLSSSALTSSVSGIARLIPSSQTINTSLGSTGSYLFQNASYVSTFTLQSNILSTTTGTINSLGNLYVSSFTLENSVVSTTDGLNKYAGSASYISSLTFDSTLVSTVSSLFYLYPTRLSVITVLNSTAQGAPFLTSINFQSTFNGLNSIGYVSLQSLTSTTDSFLNLNKVFISSLTIPSDQVNQTVAMKNIFRGGSNVFLSNQYFSSLVFPSLNNFSRQFLDATNTVTIQYTPTLFFSPTRTSSNGTLIFAISTGIQIGSTFIPETLFREKIALNSVSDSGGFSYSGSSNVYSRQFNFQMKKSTFLTAQANGFAIVHIIENSNVGGSYFYLDQEASIYSSPSNSLFISIYN